MGGKEKSGTNNGGSAGFTKEQDDKFPGVQKETNVTNKKLAAVMAAAEVVSPGGRSPRELRG